MVWQEGNGTEKRGEMEAEYSAIYMSICIKHPIISHFKFAKGCKHIVNHVYYGIASAFLPSPIMNFALLFPMHWRMIFEVCNG